MNIDLNLYSQFVQGVTSNASEDIKSFVTRILSLHENHPDINFPLLLTGAIGLAGESGELSEIVKKVTFHGKEVTPELRAHLSKELGDVIWYWTNTCRALGLDPNQVISENKDKLESRYPGGKFSIEASENRKAGDI